MMFLVEIEKIVHAERDPRLVGASIDAPGPGARSEVHAIDITGWALGCGAENRVDRVRISCNGADIRATRADRPRPDVLAHLNGISGSGTCGYITSIGMLGLPPTFELTIDAVFEGDVTARIGSIHGRRKPLRTDYNPTLRPLMLTSFGRTGTTWLMRLFMEHSAIVGYRQHPYEVRPAKYWLHTLKVLTEPANHFQSSNPDSFQYSKHQVGHNPFYCGPLTSQPAIHRYLGRIHQEQLAGSCQRSIDGLYLEMARLQQQPDPIFFCEKFHADRIPAIAWELYPGAREIILVRDFRDMLCSILAFNRKRGFRAFGREAVDSDESYVERLRTEAEGLRRAWQERSDRALLVRYEDLVQRPHPTLAAIFAYAGIDCDSATVEKIVTKASQETEEARQHRTSSDAQASIGRWHTELSPTLRDAVERALTEPMEAFGYSVSEESSPPAAHERPAAERTSDGIAAPAQSSR